MNIFFKTIKKTVV